MSERTAALGHRVSRSTISEIETGRRKSITLADFIILAAALDTAPVALIYPGPYREDIRALPELKIPQIWAVRWFSGELKNRSEVPFDDKGHYVQIPHPAEYAENLRRLHCAREAAVLYDRKAAMWRELNAMRRNKEKRNIPDGQIRAATDAIADYQRQIDALERLGEAVIDLEGDGFERLPDGW